MSVVENKPMRIQDFVAGELVLHTSHAEWGPGTITKVYPQAVLIQFNEREKNGATSHYTNQFMYYKNELENFEKSENKS